MEVTARVDQQRWLRKYQILLSNNFTQLLYVRRLQIEHKQYTVIPYRTCIRAFRALSIEKIHN